MIVIRLSQNQISICGKYIDIENVCVRERERETDRERHRERERDRGRYRETERQ